MKDFEAEIGSRVRMIREKRGYSREKLSEMANIGAKFLYEIEFGKKGMSAYTLYNISRALNVSCDYILTGNTFDNNFEYITNLLSNMDSEDIGHIEEILISILKIKNQIK